ncbi:MAG: hypothetical protein ACOYXT_10645 [Bacteroidota bacterium]
MKKKTTSICTSYSRNLERFHVLQQFKSYNPHVSEKSILFALGEAEVARVNKSVMPELLIDLPWITIEHAMIGAAREYIASQDRQQEKKVWDVTLL